MSDDVTIPAHEAKNLADFLRRHGIGEHHPMIALLNPPQPSLRDELAVLWRDEVIGVTHDSWDEVADHGKARAYEFADAVLAVVRKHVEALPDHPYGVGVLAKSDVLALLGGES